MASGKSAEFMVEFDDVFSALVWRAEHPLTLSAIGNAAQVKKVQLEPPLYQILKIAAQRGEMRISEIGEVLGVTTATASRHATTLVERGYLERKEDPTDGRAVIVRLSRGGARALQRMRQAWQDLLAELLESWPESDRRELTNGMRHLEQAFAKLHKGRVKSPAMAED